MHKTEETGGCARRMLLRASLGVVAGATVLAGKALAQSAAPEVTIDNFTFSPTPLHIASGTTVTWVNNDDMPHSIVFLSLKMHSPALDTGDKFSHRFDAAGSFNYVCGIHSFMHGQIIAS
jgi:plastocyanin